MLVPRGERGKLLKRRKVVKLCWPSESWRRLGRRSREGRLQRHGHLPYQKWKHQTRCRRRRARVPTPPPPCRPSAIAAIRAAAVTGVAFDCIGALPPPWCTVWTVKQVYTSYTDLYQKWKHQTRCRTGSLPLPPSLASVCIGWTRCHHYVQFGQLNMFIPVLQILIKNGSIQCTALAAAVTGFRLPRLNPLPPPWCTVWTVKQVHTSFTDPYQNGSIKGTAAGAIIAHCLAMMYGLENWTSQDQKRKDCAFFQY